jgi:phage shock protein A
MKHSYQPDRKLTEQFNALESKIDQAINLIIQLRKENQKLQEKISNLEKLRTTVIEQLNSIIDKIDSLV